MNLNGRDNLNGADRRSDNLTLQVVTTMKEWLEEHREEMTGHTRRIEARLDEMSKSTLAIVTEQNKALREIHTLFQKAFPDGDGDAHRRAHEQWQRKAEREEEFWLDVKKKAVASIVTGVIIWAGIVLWSAFVAGPK